jgi:hypothetical protein
MQDSNFVNALHDAPHLRFRRPGKTVVLVKRLQPPLNIEASRFNGELPPLRVCQNYGRVHLTFGDGPIPFEESVFLLEIDHLKSRAFHRSGSPTQLINWASRRRFAKLAALRFRSGASHAALTQATCINADYSHST